MQEDFKKWIENSGLARYSRVFRELGIFSFEDLKHLEKEDFEESQATLGKLTSDPIHYIWDEIEQRREDSILTSSALSEQPSKRENHVKYESESKCHDLHFSDPLKEIELEELRTLAQAEKQGSEEDAPVSKDDGRKSFRNIGYCDTEYLEQVEKKFVELGKKTQSRTKILTISGVTGSGMSSPPSPSSPTHV